MKLVIIFILLSCLSLQNIALYYQYVGNNKVNFTALLAELEPEEGEKEHAKTPKIDDPKIDFTAKVVYSFNKNFFYYKYLDAQTVRYNNYLFNLKEFERELNSPPPECS